MVINMKRMRQLFATLIAFAILLSITIPANATEFFETETQYDPAIASMYEQTIASEQLHSRAIVVIPGMAGSVLKKDGSTAWPATSLTLGQLVCSEDGVSKHVITPYNNLYGAANTYATLCTSLTNSFGRYFDIVFFPYDWRNSNSTSGAYLESSLKSYSEVILVAHSMGGLVASSFLMRNSGNRTKTKAFISLGTPFVGAAKAILTMETGEFLDGFAGLATRDGIKEIAPTINGAYQLLPTSKYISTTGFYPLNVNNNFYDYSNSISFLKSRPWALKANGQTKPMFDTAANFHSSLFSGGVHITDLSSVNCYTLAGTNRNTIRAVSYSTYINGVTDTSPNPYIYDNSGDDTVLAKSAGYGLADYYYSGVSHMGLVSDSNVINRINTIISSTTGFSPNGQTNAQNIASSFNGEIAGDQLTFNARGWINGFDNRRINVVSGGTLKIFKDGVELVPDETGELFADGESCGSLWAVENQVYCYALNDGDYNIIVPDSTPGNIRVEYMDAGYYSRISEYEGSVFKTDTLRIASHDSMAYEMIENISKSAKVYEANQSTLNILNRD